MSSSPTDFLSLPVKIPDLFRWAPALSQYIKTTYGDTKLHSEEDCRMLDQLRQRALITQQSDSSLALEDHQIYLSQLTFLESRFPSQLNLNIGWFSIFGTQEKSDTMNVVKYEKASVAYRIAGVYSQLAATEALNSVESTRKACQYFQLAAGCLQYIETELLEEFSERAPEDYAILSLLVTFLMAQAHECLWRKALMTDVKHGTVARLAVKASELYESFYSSSEVNSYIPNSWKIYSRIKRERFSALGQYYKASESHLSQQYGEEIARLRLAQRHTAEAIVSINEISTTSVYCKLNDTISTMQQMIDSNLARAEKDNVSKYKDHVPEPEQLAPILRSEMVKPIIPAFVHHPDYWLTLPNRPNDKLFIKRALFSHLTPIAVHQAVITYKRRRSELIDVIIKTKSREFSENYQKLLENLNLPYALDVIDSVPSRLVQCTEEVQHEGGIQALFDMFQKVKAMSANISKLLEKGFNALEMENEENARLIKTWGKLWKQTSLCSSSKRLLTCGTQYNDIIKEAQRADLIVEAKMNNWSKAIAMLSKPISEVQQSLPALSANDESLNLIEGMIKKIREHLQLLEELSNTGADLLSKLDKHTEIDDIQPILLKVYHEKTKNESSIIDLKADSFSPQIEDQLSTYMKFDKEFAELNTEQIEVEKSIRELIRQLDECTIKHPTLMKRAEAIGNLITAFEKFKEIRVNLVEGLKFYSHYMDFLVQFQDECNEFFISRRLEAAKLANGIK